MKLSFPPSGWSIWSKCSAQPAALSSTKKQKLITVEKSENALEGDFAHLLLAMCLDLDTSPREFIGETLTIGENTHIVDDEMGEEVDKAFEYITSFMTPGSKVWVEESVLLEKVTGVPGQKGQIDVSILVKTKKGYGLHIFDLKYGKGVQVITKDNGQMGIYALGAIDGLLSLDDKSKLKSVSLHVVQPRIGNIERDDKTRGELEKFRLKVLEAVNRASEGGEFVTGEHCRWCAMQPRCKKFADYVENAVVGKDTKFSEIGIMDLRSADMMSDDELYELFPMLELVSAWASNVRKYMDEEARRGRTFGDLRLVKGKGGNRSWKDEEQAKDYMLDKGVDKDKLYTSRLKTPAQAEKLLGRKRIDDEFHELYSKKDGVPVLAPYDDPRPSYNEALASEFDDD